MDKFQEVDNYKWVREGYFFRATGGHNWYYIFLTIHKNHVEAEVRDECDIVSMPDYGVLENGDKREFSSGGKLVFSVEIWPKYFFPEFNKDNNQWYHGDNTINDIGCMKAMFEVFQFTYDLALKEGNIKPY